MPNDIPTDSYDEGHPPAPAVLFDRAGLQRRAAEETAKAGALDRERLTRETSREGRRVLDAACEEFGAALEQLDACSSKLASLGSPRSQLSVGYDPVTRMDDSFSMLMTAMGHLESAAAEEEVTDYAPLCAVVQSTLRDAGDAAQAVLPAIDKYLQAKSTAERAVERARGELASHRNHADGDYIRADLDAAEVEFLCPKEDTTDGHIAAAENCRLLEVKLRVLAAVRSDLAKQAADKAAELERQRAADELAAQRAREQVEELRSALGLHFDHHDAACICAELDAVAEQLDVATKCLADGTAEAHGAASKLCRASLRHLRELAELRRERTETAAEQAVALERQQAADELAAQRAREQVDELRSALRLHFGHHSAGCIRAELEAVEEQLGVAAKCLVIGTPDAHGSASGLCRASLKRLHELAEVRRERTEKAEEEARKRAEEVAEHERERAALERAIQSAREQVEKLRIELASHQDHPEAAHVEEEMAAVEETLDRAALCLSEGTSDKCSEAEGLCLTARIALQGMAQPRNGRAEQATHVAAALEKQRAADALAAHIAREQVERALQLDRQLSAWALGGGAGAIAGCVGYFAVSASMVGVLAFMAPGFAVGFALPYYRREWARRTRLALTHIALAGSWILVRLRRFMAWALSELRDGTVECFVQLRRFTRWALPEVARAALWCVVQSGRFLRWFLPELGRALVWVSLCLWAFTAWLLPLLGLLVVRSAGGLFRLLVWSVGRVARR